MSESSAISETIVKRRSRSGRTPWRRTYSCIEPSSLLFAEPQVEQVLNNKFDNFRRFGVSNNHLDEKHDSGRPKTRVNSTRHIEIGGNFADISHLKNREVSIKFTSSGTVHHENAQQIGAQTSTNEVLDAQNKRTATTTRWRRHTISDISCASSFLLNDGSNKKRARQGGLSSANSPKENSEERKSEKAGCDVENENCDLSSCDFNLFPEQRSTAISLANQRKDNYTKIKSTEELTSDNNSFPDKEVGDFVLHGRYLRSCFKNNKENNRTWVKSPFDSTNIVMTDTKILTDVGGVTTLDINDNMVINVEQLKLDDSGIQSRESDAENSENNSSLYSETENESDGDKNACNGILLTPSSIFDSAIDVNPGQTQAECVEFSISKHQSDINILVDGLVNTVATEDAECRLVDGFEKDHVPEFDKTKGNTNNKIYSQNGTTRRDSEPTVRCQNIKKRTRRSDTGSQLKTRLRCTISENEGLKRLYQLAVTGMINRTKKKPSISDFISLLESKGITTNDPRLRESQTIFEKENTEGDFTQEIFTRIHATSFPLIRNILLSQITIPGFSLFRKRMLEVFETLSSTLLTLETNGLSENSDLTFDPASNYLDFMMSRRKSRDTSISMAVCTVDGQRLAFGDNDNLHPLDCCASVLNYCIACKRNGIDVMKSCIGRTPMTEKKDEYTMDDKDKILNPYTKAGVLMTTAFLPQAESIDARISALHDFYSRAMANEPLCCDNLSYNLKRLYAHEEISLAYFLSAKHKLPKTYNMTPGDILELYFQSSSTATTASTCSIAAATLAAGGICPLTGEVIFKEEIVKHAIKRMKVSNTLPDNNRHPENHGISFIWDESGCMFLIVPGVLGLVCFVQGQSKKVMPILAAFLLQSIGANFNFSVYRSLKRGKN